jgi:hypothetical protein
MELQDFLDRVASGAPIEGGSEWGEHVTDTEYQSE